MDPRARALRARVPRARDQKGQDQRASGQRAREPGAVDQRARTKGPTIRKTSLAEKGDKVGKVIRTRVLT